MPIRGLGVKKPPKKKEEKPKTRKKPLKRAGRISTLTPAVQEEVCDLIRQLVTKRSAAMSIGVSERTFHSWLEKGRDADPEKDPDNIYLQFLHAVEQAEAEAEVGLTQVVYADVDAKKNAQTALQVLAIKNAREWGKVDRAKVELDAKVTTLDLTPEDFATVRQNATPDEARRIRETGDLDLVMAVLLRARSGEG